MPQPPSLPAPRVCQIFQLIISPELQSAASDSHLSGRVGWMRGAPGNWVGAELALARRKRAQTAATRRPPPPRPPEDPRAESPLDPRQSAGGKEPGIANCPAPPERPARREGKPWTGSRLSELSARISPGGLFQLPKQKHLGVFPEKLAPAPKAPQLEETRPNPFRAFAQGSVMASSKRNSPFSRTFVCFS